MADERRELVDRKWEMSLTNTLSCKLNHKLLSNSPSKELEEKKRKKKPNVKLSTRVKAAEGERSY